MSGLVYNETRAVVNIFVHHLIRDAVVYTEHTTRKTVTSKRFCLRVEATTANYLRGPWLIPAAFLYLIIIQYPPYTHAPFGVPSSTNYVPE